MIVAMTRPGRAGWLLLGAALAAAPAANAQERPPESPEAKVQEQPEPGAAVGVETLVLARLHAVNQLEVEAGKLAARRGYHEDVKDLGERLWRDHSTADGKVAQLVEEKELAIAEVPEQQLLTEEMKAMKAGLGELRTLEHEAFDQAYLKLMERSHEASIEMLSSPVSVLAGTETGELVRTLLPILEQHLKLTRHVMRTEGEG